MPAAAVIPALIVYISIVAIKMFVFVLWYFRNKHAAST